MTSQDPTEAAPRTVEEAFRDNRRHAFSIALRILGQRDEAEDLLQDLFITASRDLRELDHHLAVRKWFTVVTVRLAQRQLRRRRSRATLGDDTPSFAGLASMGATPEQHAQLSAVYRTLDRLPSPVRMAWSLRHVEGMQLDRVAVRCGCSLATAKRRIASAEAVIDARFRVSAAA